MHKSHTAFSTKAELYARYRWDYAPQAIETMVTRSRLGKSSRVADIAAGTGILTRHLVGQAGFVIAVEPNPQMRRMAARELAGCSGCAVLAAGAEACALEAASLDLISVAQAIHWFQPEPARQEFRRVLKPGGWLAIIRNATYDSPAQQAVAAFQTEEYGVSSSVRPLGSGVAPESYFEGGTFERLTFDFVSRQNWESFLGALLSASYSPDPGHPRYAAFEEAARTVFARFASQGQLETACFTELYLGQPGIL